MTSAVVTPAAKAASLFPTPAEVEAATPAGRDRAIDVIRIVSLAGVVFGHTVMATSTIRDGVFYWSNLLTASTVFQALTWVFQIMPLFFFAGVAASVASWRPGTSCGGWLLKRCTRLYRPVFYYLVFWAVTLSVLRFVLPVHVYEPVAGISIQLLWFLGAYVLVLAAVPLLARITTTAQLAAAVIGTYAFIAVIDAIRITTAGKPASPETRGVQPSTSSAPPADRPKAGSGNGFASPGLRTVGEFADGSAGEPGATVRANMSKSNAEADADGADASRPPQSAPENAGWRMRL